MKSKNKEHPTLNVAEAIATLSAITHMDDQKIHDEHDEALHSSDAPALRHYKWLETSSRGKSRIQDAFSVILSYLQKFYKNEHSYLTDPQTLEGIKNIMALVGDAAKKMDSCPPEFRLKGSVSQLKEYKQLNEFYRSRIAHQVNEGVLSRWILAVSQDTLARQKELAEQKEFSRKAATLEEAPRHLFVNLEAVKKDAEYELFFIRKEDGSLFFSPRLVRSMKLICDFSAAAHDKDPLLNISVWIDLQMHNAAKAILLSAHDQIEEFYHAALKFKHRELVAILHKSLMALFLCANSRNLLQDLTPESEKRKNCYSYFQDFIFFLREAYHSDEYHKLIAYHSEVGRDLNPVLLDVMHAASRAIYLCLDRFHDFDEPLKKIFALAESVAALKDKKVQGEKYSLSSAIEQNYLALEKVLKWHTRGPLGKILEALHEGSAHAFEPFAQLNIPSRLFAIAVTGHKILNIHLPSPTYQEYIHRVTALDEFKGFLRSCSAEAPPHRHLLINLQDRISWKEHFRSLVLEELRVHDNLNKALTTVTIGKDADFYHQLPPYDENNHAVAFIDEFKAQLSSENSGYFFPSSIKSAILTDFVDGAMAAIHRIFFSSKNILLREHRLNFIEIFDLFLTLKILDVVKPNSFSQTCKDGVDIAASTNGLLFIFLKLVSKEPMNEESWTQFKRMFYGPALIVRERLPLKERFERFLEALKVMELVHEDLGHEVFGKVIREAFGRYYKSPIFDAFS